MSRRTTLVGMVTMVLLWLSGHDARSQSYTWNRQRMPSLARSGTVLSCTWQYYWDPPDAYADIENTLKVHTGGKSTYYSFGSGLFGYAQLETALDATYLPTTTVRCGNEGVILWPGYTGPFPYLEESLEDWDNPGCNGYPPRQWGDHPSVSYWITEELTNASAFVAQSFEGGAGYWGAVGAEAHFPQMHTQQGGEVPVYPSSTLPPDYPGEFLPNSRIIFLNVVHFGTSYNASQWAFVGAHELGHAHGFDHAHTAGTDHSIMQGQGGGASGLHTRFADKCAVVATYPADLQIS